MHIFYISNISGRKIILDEKESKHAVKVLRLVPGAKVNIVDGKGGFYTAEITIANTKKCTLSIINVQKNFGKKNFGIHIAIAPTKNITRFEWFLEKAVEIGIDEITPLLSDHSERKNIKYERLQKILISAMKQSQKAYLPILNPLTPFDELIKKANENERFIAHCDEGEKLHLKNLIKREKNVVVLIGPEGDFSRGEIKVAHANGFKEISLGSARLRTETAGVVACHIVNLANE